MPPISKPKMQTPVDLAQDRSRLLGLLKTASHSEAWNIMEELSINSESHAKSSKIGNSSRQRQYGVYYTSFDLARAIVEEAVRVGGSSEGTFFEPCVGGGAFLLSFIDTVMSRGDYSKGALTTVLSKCFIADKDEVSLTQLQEALPHYFASRYGHYVSFPSENVFSGDSLLDTRSESAAVREMNKSFGVEAGFDFIITNPPYLLLRPDSRLGTASTDETVRLLAKIKRERLFLFTEGNLNLYKLFTEAILSKWLAPDGVAGLLVPRSLLTDFQSRKLRAFLISNFELGPILNLEEGNPYFKSVGQSFSAFAAKRAGRTTQVHFAKLSVAPPGFDVMSSTSIGDLGSLVPNGGIFPLSKTELVKLRALSKLETIADSPPLVNLRGEFDITLDTRYLTDKDTGLKLVRGSDIAAFSLRESNKFVLPEFLDRPKGKWTKLPRIACHQISNANSSRRLKWALVPPNHILANSTNFIAIDPDQVVNGNFADLEFLLGILNSEAMNWRFKLLSPNNHISNAEIGSFPIGRPSGDNLKSLKALVRKLNQGHSKEGQQLLDIAVFEYLFGELSNKEH